ncbi:MAG: polyprenyl synthetase family protein [Myxococcales bacterium]|nr:polyprenyl synthetase family protein [Myxococcales bacterium]
MTLDEHLLPHMPALHARLHAIGSAPTRAGVAAPRGSDLATMATAQLTTGGKRLRGLLPPALVAAAGGPLDAALELGACIELAHNGTLVHDDIQDGDRERRGQPTLWTRHGVPQAINAGDFMLLRPVAHLLASHPIEGTVRPALAHALAEAIVETISGQVADIGLRDATAPTRAMLRPVFEAKTGPLFGVCLGGAALLVNGTAPAQAHAAACALGLAFQIRDDLLDLVGSKGRLRGADLAEGKVSWPVAIALERMPAAEAAALRSLLTRAAQGEKPPAATIGHWLARLEACDVAAAARTDLAAALDDFSLQSRALPAAFAPVLQAIGERLTRLDG